MIRKQGHRRSENPLPVLSESSDRRVGFTFDDRPGPLCWSQFFTVKGYGFFLSVYTLLN